METSTISSSTLLLQQSMEKFDIARDYFASILNAQLIIFSVIVGALVALYFLFNWKVSKDQIKKEVDAEVKRVKEDVLADAKKQLQEQNAELTKSINDHSQEIAYVRGEVYRTLGEFWDSQERFPTAFIWWMRAAQKFWKNNEKLARIALGSAKESVERIDKGYLLNSDLIGEFQKIMPEIDDVRYKIEKELLDKAIKDVLIKK